MRRQVDVLLTWAMSNHHHTDDPRSMGRHPELTEHLHKLLARIALGLPVRDVTGGWDVSLGNIVLSAQGVPSCVSHGDLETTDGVSFHCVGCGARGIYTIPAESAG